MAIAMTAGRDLMNAKLAASEARVARFMWAGALANGAALVALVGLIGNVPAPDEALIALRWPLLIFALGVAAGGLAGGQLAAIAELELLVATDAALYESVLAGAVSDRLKDIQVTLAILEGRFYGAAKPSPRRMGEAKGRLEDLAKAVSARAAEVATVKGRRVTSLRRLVYAAFACFLAGALWIVGASLLGAKLQPTPATETRSVVIQRGVEPSGSAGGENPPTGLADAPAACQVRPLSAQRR